MSKDLLEDVVLSFPGFEKILEPFKDSGDAKVKKDLVNPEEDPHFSANTDVTNIPEPNGPIDTRDEGDKPKKAKKPEKKLAESINNYKAINMKSKNKFDELFENVMGEEDVLAFGAGDEEVDFGADEEMSDEMEDTHNDLAAKIKSAIDSLQEIHDELSGGGDEGEGEEDIEVDVEDEGIEDADENYAEDEGYDDAMEAVEDGVPKAANTNVGNLTSTGNNKVSGKLGKASGGKAQGGSTPSPQADPKAHNPAPAVSKLTSTGGGSQKVGGTITGAAGKDLF